MKTKRKALQANAEVIALEKAALISICRDRAGSHYGEVGLGTVIMNYTISRSSRYRPNAVPRNS